jgi:RNA methyltransferase, TrmH family
MHLSRRRSSEIASLVYRKYRQRHGQFIVEGERAVLSALAAGADLAEIIVSDTFDDARVVEALAETATMPLITVAPDVFARLSDVQTSQGVLAVASLNDVSADAAVEKPRILAFDGLQDPGNVGTIIRTAAWFGVDVIVAGKGTADVFSPKCVRATMGAIFDVAVHLSDDLSGFLDQAKEAQFELVAADMSGVSLEEWTPADRTVLVVGNEGAGISEDVASRVDRRITIQRPANARSSGVESLNVAIASSIILNRWARH